LQIGNRAALSTDSGISTALTNNAFHNGTNFTYSQTATALLYRQEGGQHEWFNAPSGTAGNAISFTQAMTLGSNSGLSIGTPSAAPSQGLLVQGASIFNGNLSLENAVSPRVSVTGNTATGFPGYNLSNTTQAYEIIVRGNLSNAFQIRNTTVSADLLSIASTGAATFSSSIDARGNIAMQYDSTAANQAILSHNGTSAILYSSGNTTKKDFTIYRDGGVDAGLIIKGSNGNVLIGTTTDAGFKLDVNGTGRFSGNVSLNQAANPQLNIVASNSTGVPEIYLNRSTSTTVGYIGAGVNSTVTNVGDFVVLENRLSTGGIALRTNNSTRLTIDSTGAATFSSSVTSLAAAGATFVRAATSGGSDVRITSGASVGFVGTTSNHSLSFVTNNNVVATIGTDAAVNFGGSVLAVGITSSASVAFPHTTKSANYTLNATDYTVGFDCASNRTATLPDATTCAGRVYVIYQYNTNIGSRYVTLDGNGSQTINGLTTFSLQYYEDFTSVMIQSNGSNWVVIANSVVGGAF
jgi:hypothetical protein